MCRILTVSADSISVGPVPPAGYVYRINGKVSLHRYHNAASARYDASQVQYEDENGRLEPYDSAVRFGRAPRYTGKPFSEVRSPYAKSKGR